MTTTATPAPLNADPSGPDLQPRCRWCGTDNDMRAYHDTEWGFPVASDQRLFEKLSLETFQSGLSWRTILNKRENFRAAFAQFEPARVAGFTDDDVARLLADAGIVRHRGKIEAVIHNAARVAEIQAEAGSLAAFLWQFEPPANDDTPAVALATSPESHAMARALKQRGWKFFGPTTAYAFMQSMGMVNDHAHGCITHAQVRDARQSFTRPSR